MPWTLFDTNLGRCGVAWSDAGLTWFQLPEESREQTEARLLAKAEGAGARATPRATPAWVTRAIELARAHLDGRSSKAADLTTVPLDLSRVTAFAEKVYRELQRVPAGSTVTYGELARAVGSPGAPRAIGRAMATNPIPLFVPCHRVLASNGKPGGFSAYGGLVTKERILVLEGWRPRTSPLFSAASATSRAPPRYDVGAARRHLTASDPVLGAHIDRIGDFTLTLKASDGTFAALAESIVYQQLNGKAAAKIFDRVRALVPKGRAFDARTVLALDEASLRGAGLSASKLASIRDLATRAAAGTIPTLAQLEHMDDDAIVDALTEVRGIGRWTVEMLLIFRLGRADVLPIADYGIKKGFARVFHRGERKNVLPTDDELARRGERWRPFRSMASWYLWRAVDS